MNTIVFCVVCKEKGWRHPETVIVEAIGREEAKSKARLFLGGNPDKYTVSPLTKPGAPVRYIIGARRDRRGNSCSRSFTVSGSGTVRSQHESRSCEGVDGRQRCHHRSQQDHPKRTADHPARRNRAASLERALYSSRSALRSSAYANQ